MMIKSMEAKWSGLYCLGGALKMVTGDWLDGNSFGAWPAMVVVVDGVVLDGVVATVENGIWDDELAVANEPPWGPIVVVVGMLVLDARMVMASWPPADAGASVDA